jgi:hypothetical protein
MQDLLTAAATATEIAAIALLFTSFVSAWTRTAPTATAPAAAIPTPAATVEPVAPTPAPAVEPEPIVESTFTADEQITTTIAPDYHAMTLTELKAIGKQRKIKGWQVWKKPATAIAKLEALAA